MYCVQMFLAIFLPFLVPSVCRYEYIEKLRAKFARTNSWSPTRQWASAVAKHRLSASVTAQQKRASDTQLLLLPTDQSLTSLNKKFSSGDSQQLVQYELRKRTIWFKECFIKLSVATRSNERSYYSVFRIQRTVNVRILLEY